MSTRIEDIYRPADERRADFREVERGLTLPEIREQAKRCMNCGIPFCHGGGCPLGNVIPEFNAAVAVGNERLAWQILSETSAFPEFTARVCPAPCEGSCTCGIGEEPVMIRQMELHIIEQAFANGWVTPNPPRVRRKESVAVIGSGPAGLVMADALNRQGFRVVVYERHAKPGGLLRYGIPDFKLDKAILDRRLALLTEAGISFVCGTEVGRDISAAYLADQYDAIVLAMGTPVARELDVPGRDCQGIHLAMDFLSGQNRVVSGEWEATPISAKGRRVVVIGGGDTGSDCLGTAIRQGAASVAQIEIMPEPPATRSPSTPWPDWPYQKRSSSSHKEADVVRRWSLSTRRFVACDGHVSGVEVAPVDWQFSPQGKPLRFTERPEAVEVLEADLVLLAMGFTGVAPEGVVAQLDLACSVRGAVAGDSKRRVFTIGDTATGASLVVRAMADARRVAQEIGVCLTTSP